MNKTIFKGFKIRIYPNKQQKILIEKHFGCCRFIWNYMLNLQNETYKETGKFLSGYDMSKIVTSLKKQEEFSFLKEVSNKSLECICGDLADRINKFRKNIINRPKFKSKKNVNYRIQLDLMYFV